MRKLCGFLLAVTAVVACDSATDPRAFTLGPGCTKYKMTVLNADGTLIDMKVTTYNRDCTKLNLDSLIADGWVVTWDTTWTH